MIVLTTKHLLVIEMHKMHLVLLPQQAAFIEKWKAATKYNRIDKLGREYYKGKNGTRVYSPAA